MLDAYERIGHSHVIAGGTTRYIILGLSGCISWDCLAGAGLGGTIGQD